MATVVPVPRPDLEAYEYAMRLALPIVASELRTLLGPRLVAYIAGVTETRAVHEWADGVRAPRPAVAERLRFTLRVARFIAERDSSGVAQAWFQGLNPQLEDRSPARLLREGNLEEIGPLVLAAARAFVIGG